MHPSGFISTTQHARRIPAEGGRRLRFHIVSYQLAQETSDRTQFRSYRLRCGSTRLVYCAAPPDKKGLADNLERRAARQLGK